MNQLRTFLALGLWVVIAQCNAQGVTAQEYFYLDSQCSSCVLGVNEKPQKIYAMSNAIYTGSLTEIEIATHISTFKEKLTEAFGCQELTKNVVLRKLENKPELIQLREVSVNKYRVKGYEVNQISYDPY